MDFPKKAGALVLLVLALAVVVVGQPDLDDRLARLEPKLDAQLAAREVQIDPGELLDLMHNNRVRLAVLDVRDEGYYNLFHIVDARRLEPEPGEDTWVRDLQPEDVKVVVAQGEERAEVAWKYLTALGVLNLYILEGGVDGWLDVYEPGHRTRTEQNSCFDAALGGRHPASNPDPKHAPKREFTPKVKVRVAASVSGGGCG